MFYCLLASMVSDKKSSHLNLCFPISHISLAAFKNLSLSLVFSILILMCLGVFLSEFSCLRSDDLFKSINICLLLNLGKSLISFSNTFVYQLFSIFILGLSIAHMFYHLVMSHESLKLYLNFIFLSVLQIVYFILIYLQVD